MKLIIEMEMPRACPCELATEIEGYFYPCFAYYGVVERAAEFDKCMRDGKRPDWCPIKGILPDEHGDLIDRDVMYKEIQLWKSTATDTITRCFLYHVERLLMSIRPIVAAERKHDEQIH